MIWRRVDSYHQRRSDGACVCACKAGKAWRFRASRTVRQDSVLNPGQAWEWAGPWRDTAEEARGDV